MLAIVAIVALMVGSALAFYLWRIDHAVNSIPREETFQPSATVSRAPSATPAPGAANPPETFVLLGSDARGDLNGRSDVLMVAHVSGDRKQITLTSFPRDLWVPIPGHGEAKINAAFAYGGPALTMLTLEQLLGVRMNHSMLIDFEGFISLTDMMGGVDIDNRYASCSDGFCWHQGTIHISGAEALAYVRQRHDLPGGDLARAERQRNVVKAIALKAASGTVLSNPAKFAQVLDAGSKCVTVDSTLTPDYLKSFAMSLKVTGGDSIKQLTAPFLGTSWSDDGQWIEVPDEAGMKELGNAMRSDKMSDYYEKHKSDQPKFEPYGTKSPPPGAESPRVTPRTTSVVVKPSTTAPLPTSPAEVPPPVMTAAPDPKATPTPTATFGSTPTKT